MPKSAAASVETALKLTARFFFENGVAFHIVDSPAFKDMLKCVAKIGPSYVPPSRRVLSGRLLDEVKDDVDAESSTILKSRNDFGCTLVTDGWTSITKKHMVNYLTVQHLGVKFECATTTSNAQAENITLGAEWIKEDVS